MLAAESEVAGGQVLSSLARIAGAAAVRQDTARAGRVRDAGLRRPPRRFQEGGRRSAAEHRQRALFPAQFPEALAAYEQRLALERERQDEPEWPPRSPGSAHPVLVCGVHRGAGSLQEALALHEKADDVAGIAFVSLSIGNIGFLQGDFPAAIAAYRRALDLNRTMFNVDGESRALEGLGRVYSAEGDYAAALGAFDAVQTDKRLATPPPRLAPVAQSMVKCTSASATSMRPAPATRRAAGTTKQWVTCRTSDGCCRRPG